MTNIYKLKFLILGLLILNLCNTQITFTTKFKACSEEWGQDKLWLTRAYPKQFNYTFCNDEEDEVTYVNSKLITLLATYMSNLKRQCGYLQECTPGKINQIIIKNDE